MMVTLATNTGTAHCYAHNGLWHRGLLENVCYLCTWTVLRTSCFLELLLYGQMAVNLVITLDSVGPAVCLRSGHCCH
jgi:hypothetical protein